MEILCRVRPWLLMEHLSGTVTDMDGNFELTVSEAHVNLKFAFIGYADKTMRYNVAAKAIFW